MNAPAPHELVAAEIGRRLARPQRVVTRVVRREVHLDPKTGNPVTLIEERTVIEDIE